MSTVNTAVYHNKFVLQSCIELDKYIKWADGFIVVYSVASKSSFLEAQAYLKHIRIQCQQKGVEMQPTILVGNKKDLDRLRFEDICKMSKGCFN